MLPEGFVYVRDVIAQIREEIRYAGCHNFTGRPVAGYHAPRAVLTKQAAQALKSAAEFFEAHGYGMLIYDAYRPARATACFAKWARDTEDTIARAEFYPQIAKSELFDRGYISMQSGHSRGSTVDVTLTDSRGEPMDMGSGFDLFSPVSRHDWAGGTPVQAENRRMLRIGMEACGFAAYEEEWWHYTLVGEPYPDTYFDFVIEESPGNLGM